MWPCGYVEGWALARRISSGVILLIDNYDSFTWNLVQGFATADQALDIERDVLVVRNDQITPDRVAALDQGRGPTHIVISPGPGTPKDAGVSGAVIERFAGKVPILGVCLGHQCLAAMHGMRVERHLIQVHGKTSEIHHDGQGVFAGLPSPFTAMRYHSLTVEGDSVPRGWTISAWAFEPTDRPGEQRKVVMGLRREFDTSTSAPMEGVQFHPESFMTAEGPGLLRNFLSTKPRPTGSGRFVQSHTLDASRGALA